MPIKWVDDVKDLGLRSAGQEWQKIIGCKLTTRDLDNLAEVRTYDPDRYPQEVAAVRKRNRRKRHA